MSRLKALSLFLVLLLFSLVSSAVDKCGPLLPQAKLSKLPHALGESDPTGELIAYLTVLEENDIIGANEIQKFTENLDKNILENPITKKLAKASVTQEIHREALETYFSGASLDIKRLKDWTQRNLVELKTEDVERDTVETKTGHSFSALVFLPVKARPFRMGSAKKEKHREVRLLSNSFEMMSTPVTQFHWAQLMKKNPARFVEGESSITLNIDGSSIVLQPDNPIERVTWWSAVAFANKLSVAHGLKPAYILDDSALEGDAAEGTLRSKNQLIRYNSSTGSVYDTEGYRLPTEAEQELVLRAGGAAQGKYAFGDDVDKLEAYAWFNRNSDQKTQAVAKKLPIIIEGQEFFDLLGNVEEWSNDWYSETPLPGANPRGPSTGKEKVIRGGSWIGDRGSLESTTRWYGNPNHATPVIGFRLVRTIK